jgi:UTP--glucose-1-phosphate uridylyltransferase
MQVIRKAVFPVAGLGTRLLPATKASPKEMLPVLDKPLIQYAVEEAIAAGITDMIFVTGRTKRSIEDHFDKAYELESELERRGKTQMLALIRNMLPRNINCIYVRQTETLGLGHAVLCARPIVGDEPFAVLLADDLIDNEPGVMKQMVDVHAEYQCSLLGVMDVPRAQTASYGIVASTSLGAGLGKVRSIVEKPLPESAPSTLGVVGRYVLTPRIFQHLAAVGKGSGGEIQLTDAIESLLREEHVLTYRYDGTRYDCGSKLGYLEATLAYALKHPELRLEAMDLIDRYATECRQDAGLDSALELGRPHAPGLPLAVHSSGKLPRWFGRAG